MAFISTVSSLFPQTLKTYEALNVPIGVSLTPSVSKPLPRIQFPRNSIPRCLYCKGYVSPYCDIDMISKV